MRDLVIIPARGGSKGIPGKNIKPLGGKPLILYALENAQSIADKEDICVSTDSEGIRRVVEEAGVAVPFLRPAELATDKSGTYEVLLHALDFYEKQGRKYDRVILLQPTSPFLKPEQIREAMALWSKDIDMVVSVKESAASPYYNLFETDADGFLEVSKGGGNFTRRQDAPKVWEYNGAVYVITTESLKRSPLNKFARRVPYPMPASDSVDLDTPMDWLIAEAMLHAKD